MEQRDLVDKEKHRAQVKEKHLKQRLKNKEERVSTQRAKDGDGDEEEGVAFLGSPGDADDFSEGESDEDDEEEYDDESDVDDESEDEEPAEKRSKLAQAFDDVEATGTTLADDEAMAAML